MCLCGCVSVNIYVYVCFLLHKYSIGKYNTNYMNYFVEKLESLIYFCIEQAYCRGRWYATNILHDGYPIVRVREQFVSISNIPSRVHGEQITCNV